MTIQEFYIGGVMLFKMHNFSNVQSTNNINEIISFDFVQLIRFLV